MKLRTKFLLASLLISTALTAVCLYLVGRVIGAQARNSVAADLRNSIRTFQNVQSQREAARIRSTRLVADLPIVRALMTTEDRRTIQDASASLAKLADADIFVLSDRDGRLMALHDGAESTDRGAAENELRKSLGSDLQTHWWFLGGRLYEVSLQPIYFGNVAEGRLLGHVVVGYEIDDRIVRELSEVAGSEVTFFHEHLVVRSTLPDRQRSDLIRFASVPSPQSELVLDGDRFVVDSMELNAHGSERVQLVVLKSLDKATAALRSLRRMLTITGIIAVTAGAILVFVISFTFTLPIRKLVEGVRALGRGDYEYSLPQGGSDEVAEVTAAFARMREDLRRYQRELLENEKLATIGRMASSISHDLRHQLVAVLANAEFLLDQRRSESEREELYSEVKAGVTEMNEVLESLLEFSRTSASLRRTRCDLRSVVDRALHAARRHPSYHEIPVRIEIAPNCEGDFDSKKLERVFQNLLLNSFSVVGEGSVAVTAVSLGDVVEVRVADTGPGIPAEIRKRIFEPFFSYGKENGTGLGLSVAQKIVQDHGGELKLEDTSSAGTVFVIRLPICAKAPRQVLAQNI